VLFRSIGVGSAQVGEGLQHLAGHQPLETRHHIAGLHHLTRDVQGQVFRINHALHKTKVKGQEIDAEILDEHLAGNGGDVQQGIHLHRSVNDHVRVHQRIAEIEGELLVKLAVSVTFHRAR